MTNPRSTWFADLWPMLWFVALAALVLSGLTACMARCDRDREYEPAAQSEFTR